MLCINIPKTCSLNWHRMSVSVQSIRESCIIWGWEELNLRKYNDFAPIGLKSGFENVINQFDIEISLICGFAPQMGDKSLVFWEV